MKTFREVIEAFGGTEKFRSAVGVQKYPTAAGWYRRNSIPSAWWPEVVCAAEATGVVGVSLEALAKMAASRKVEVIQ